MPGNSLGSDTGNHTYSFEIRGAWWKTKTFPSLNDYIAQIGRNPKAGGRMKEQYMLIAANAVRGQLRGLKIVKPVIIHYEFFEPKDGHIRDVMNIFSCADKFIEDALVKLKVLQNDNPGYVVNTTHEFRWIDEEPYIKVTLEEVDNVGN